jgi:serine-type D-Ala-D-Ala carboxypeptidase (penicillin-binding protein 5/6)
MLGVPDRRRKAKTVRKRPHCPCLIVIATLLLCAATLHAAPAENAGRPSPEPIALLARSAILIDQATGRILYQRNPDQALVPASLAKLMTLHIVLEKLADKSISRTDVVSLSANAWADNQAPGSTVMHLGPGQIVTVEELMKGMVIASGNDAATALAEYVAGSVEAFVRMMNDEARFMGFTTMHFTDPAGVRTDNTVTARDFAQFCRRYIDLHPESLAEIHSLREFVYPLPQNVPGMRLAPLQTRTQYNGNYLVWDRLGVDGLKTGHLDDENFTAAITAMRGDTRLVVVLLGVPGATLGEGARNRTADELALLSYGFRTYGTVTIEPPSVSPVRVWKGSTRSLAVASAPHIALTLRENERSQIVYSILLQSPLVAPVMKGQKVGDIVYTAGTEEVGRIPLLAGEDVPAAGFVRRALDSLSLGISALAARVDNAFALALDTIHPRAVASVRSTDRD